jgi:hypothetical protein
MNEIQIIPLKKNIAQYKKYPYICSVIDLTELLNKIVKNKTAHFEYRTNYSRSG